MMQHPAISPNASLSRVRKRTPSRATRGSERLEQAAHSERAAKASITADISRLPSPPSIRDARVSKRKRTQDSDCHSNEEPSPKRGPLYHVTPPSESCKISPVQDQYGALVRWEEYFGAWPPRTKMDDHRANKRARTPTSYTQSVKDGKAPIAWTPQHEQKMREAGVFMTEIQTLATITDECQRLCSELCAAEYALPDEPAFRKDRLIKTLEEVRLRSEARVVRDVTPIVVPSPELLHIDGYAGLSNVREALNVEWVKCDTLGGPHPRPDFVGGISASAFSEPEIDSLKLHHTSACPNLFPENVYFPFLICEAKGSASSIEEAERQVMHSASIAVRAVIQLYRKASAVMEVDRKILAFSVAHNGRTVKIFGHFAKIDGEKLTFLRHQVLSMDFSEDLTSQTSHKWARAYKIIRAIYDQFFPQHLKRIQSALSRLPAPSLASVPSQLGLDEGSQASTPNSSQDGRFKKPSLPSAILQREYDRLSEALREQKELLAQQREESREHSAILQREYDRLSEALREQKEQLAQQQDESERRLAQQREESRDQRAMMERQLAQQKDESERRLAQQREESRDQKAMMERQLDQQKEIIQLLKESR